MKRLVIAVAALLLPSVASADITFIYGPQGNYQVYDYGSWGSFYGPSGSGMFLRSGLPSYPVYSRPTMPPPGLTILPYNPSQIYSYSTNTPVFVAPPVNPRAAARQELRNQQRALRRGF